MVSRACTVDALLRQPILLLPAQDLLRSCVCFRVHEGVWTLSLSARKAVEPRDTRGMHGRGLGSQCGAAARCRHMARTGQWYRLYLDPRLLHRLPHVPAPLIARALAIMALGVAFVLRDYVLTNWRWLLWFDSLIFAINFKLGDAKAVPTMPVVPLPLLIVARYLVQLMLERTNGVLEEHCTALNTLAAFLLAIGAVPPIPSSAELLLVGLPRLGRSRCLLRNPLCCPLRALPRCAVLACSANRPAVVLPTGHRLCMLPAARRGPRDLFRTGELA